MAFEGTIDDAYMLCSTWKKYVLREWRAANWVTDYDFGAVDPLAAYVSAKHNGEEVATVIPIWAIYKGAWDDSKLKNPFDVSWINIDIIGNDEDWVYLQEILLVLEAQKDLWDHDDATKNCKVFKLFIKFIRALHILYDCRVNHSSSLEHQEG